MVLTREAESPGGARYAVTVYEPEVTHAGEARIEGGDVTLELDAPQWTRGFVERLLKSLAKKHADDGAWPRKITRWRAP